MQSGLSLIDNLISKHGVSVSSASNPFEVVTPVTCDDADNRALSLPYCVYNKVKDLDTSDKAKLIRLFIPSKKARLAMFLVVNDQVKEQVYYQRDRRYVNACDKLKQMIQSKLQQDGQLAA